MREIAYTIYDDKEVTSCGRFVLEEPKEYMIYTTINPAKLDLHLDIVVGTFGRVPSIMLCDNTKIIIENKNGLLTVKAS